jgi:hypothetical protein
MAQLDEGIGGAFVCKEFGRLATPNSSNRAGARQGLSNPFPSGILVSIEIPIAEPYAF